MTAVRAAVCAGAFAATLAALTAATNSGGANDSRPARTAAVAAVTVSGPAEDTLHDATPIFRVAASGVAGAGCDVELTLEIAGTFDFAGPLIHEESRCGDTATIVLSRALPERRTVYWRARVASASGERAVSAVTGPRSTAAWLTLRAPNSPNGSTVQTRRPTFVWHSARAAVQK